MPRMERHTAVAVPVVGMHRSGTSMVARMLEAGGVEFGDHAELAGPNEDNPLGFWEHEGFRGINEELLRRAGGDWRNPPVLGKDALLNPSNADLQERSRELLASLDGLGPSFGWKDPRTSLVLPFWLHLWTGPMRAICCLRHPAAVASRSHVASSIYAAR